jgi:hypothetical protein
MFLATLATAIGDSLIGRLIERFGAAAIPQFARRLTK